MSENTNNSTDRSKHVYEPEHFGRQSADVVVPLLLELCRGRIGSVVDVGCGIGTWLASFADHGVEDYRGLDGVHVPRDRLMIAAEHFTACDLEAPVKPDRRFDLCLSLEVAEHLHEASADRFVRLLTSLADTVVFSAAIPGQTGQNHFNMQWPDYWAAKFAQRGYPCYDVIRPRIWGDDRVHWWYQQNMLLFIHSSVEHNLTPCDPMPRVHPAQYRKVLQRLDEVIRSRRRTPWKRLKDRLS